MSLFNITEKSLNEFNVGDALAGVNDWFELGKKLKLPDNELDVIRLDYNHYGLKHMRSRMVNLWLRTKLKASWGRLCVALEAINEREAAERIRVKYNIPGQRKSCLVAHVLKIGRCCETEILRYYAPLEMPFPMESFFAKVKFFRIWPKTMDYNKVFWPKSRSFFVVHLVKIGRCYEAEICASMLPLRCAFA